MCERVHEDLVYAQSDYPGEHKNQDRLADVGSGFLVEHPRDA